MVVDNIAHAVQTQLVEGLFSNFFNSNLDYKLLGRCFSAA